MSENENEQLQKQLEEVKTLDEDLFDENYDAADPQPSNEEKENTEAKDKKGFKLLMIFVAITMIISVIGPISNYFNMASIQFLKKSYELSKMEEIQQYKEAIVTIKSEDRKGTGFNISSKGLIVTNYNIVQDQESAIINFPDGPISKGTIVSSHPELDIALVQIHEQNNLPTLEIEYTKTWEKHDPIYFIGNPLMFQHIANEGSLLGETTNTGLAIPAMILHAPIYSGNSGSPVITMEGKVIGVIYAKTSTSIENEKKKIGLAVPTYLIEDIIREQLEEREE